MTATQSDEPHGRAAWHHRSAAETAALLGTSAQGITDDEAVLRLARHGPNVLTGGRRHSILVMVASQFADVTIAVLIGAAVISGLIGERSDTYIILAIVALNAAVGIAQEARAERAMGALKRIAAPSATVLREGRCLVIPAANIVPGDAVLLEAGVIVPADLRLIAVAGLRVNEATLTGESLPVDKIVAPVPRTASVSERVDLAFKGTTVTAGRGLGYAVETGMRTELGRIAGILGEARRIQTPLQRRLASFGRQLALVVAVICAAVFATGVLRGEPALPMFLTALSLAVAAIPEALPAVVSIALALGARRMAAEKALVRRLAAVETLGSVTFICSDKTGTLTANEMRVEQYFCDGARSAVLGSSTPWRRLLEAMAVSHDAYRDAAGEAHGDPTELALLVAAEAAGLARGPALAQLPRIAEIPFDSGRKCMTTVHRSDDGRYLSVTKGAAEVVIGECSRELRGASCTTLDRDALLREADRMAGEGLRVLAFAVRSRADMPETTSEGLERGLDFVALVGLLDPPRPQAARAVALCACAGIIPVMITGDHPETARAIARRTGILRGEGEVLSGRELAALGDKEFSRRVRDVRVYARVAPEQKVRIVTTLQDRGEIVAMTGDGVNDAPALQCADIGVAMGLTGTDVAKEASSMVLLDDDFATLVKAVHEGRRIYDNLRRFVRYVLTTNSGEVWTIFLAPFLGLPVPLLAIQILWINLVTDSLPGLALAAEPPEPDAMRRAPRPPNEGLFARGLGTHALLFGVFMAGLVLAVQAWALREGSQAWRTMAFTALCFSQIGHVLGVRSERASILTLPLFGNVPLLGAVLLTAGLQLAVVYVPALEHLLSTSALSPAQLAVCAGCGVLILLAVELEKGLRRRIEARAARRAQSR